VKNEDGSLQESYDKQSNNITTQYDYTFLSSGEIDAYITITFPDSSNQFNTTTYFTNGTISLSTMYESAAGAISFGSPLWYQPNGIVQDENGTVVTDAGKISQFEPYQQLWDSRPLQTYADAANLYVSTEQNILGSVGNQSSVTLFTSDYGLDWFDYQAGYDVVLGQLGWNQSTTQNIALVRGGADMQNKSWGTIIDWQSQVPIVLPSGDQMYSEMKQSYESGATYVVAFNYSPGNNGTGLLQKEQFSALQKFWSDVVRNPKETNNVTGQDALVLPSDYGWGMRNQNDTIWGLWGPDNNSQAVWNALQSSLSKYGSKLDIVYDDPTYPVAGRYQHVYYWNQTI
jgi:hypothetical protein